MTRDRSLLIKIMPPEGYDVYRLHLSRSALVAGLAALVIVVAGALGLHAWQLHAAENDVQMLREQAADQRLQLAGIDREADALAAGLQDMERQNAAIRRLLGDRTPAAHAVALERAATDAALTPPSVAALRGRLDRLAAAATAQRAESTRLGRLARRVLNVRRLAAVARDRLLAAIPSINPVGGGIASGFGWRVDPWPEFHQGVDLEAEYGTPVHATADGVVVATGWDGGFGNKLDLGHGNGYHTWYAHLSRFAVDPGTRVRRGDVIAFVGATGDATGPHLHYQVMRAGEPIDPAPYLDGIPPAVLATLPAAPRVQ